jgi:hypothetical protein
VFKEAVATFSTFYVGHAEKLTLIKNLMCVSDFILVNSTKLHQNEINGLVERCYGKFLNCNFSVNLIY